MKKVLLLILMITLAISIPAAYKDQNKMLSMPVSAQLGTYHQIIINTFNNEGIYSSDGVGMPFDLTGADVQYVETGLTAGREIGEWSLHSNYTPLTIKIDAQNMSLVPGTAPSDSTGQTDGLKYILFFPYEFEAQKDSGEQVTVTGFMKVSSGTPYDSAKEKNAICGEGLQSVNTRFFPIRFMLAEDINVSTFSPGTYIGYVTVMVEGGL